MAVSLGPLHGIKIFWMIETMILIVSLMFINIRGVRHSSRLNEVLGAMDLILETTVVILGFVLAWHPQLLASQWTYGITYPAVEQVHVRVEPGDYFLCGAGVDFPGGAGDTTSGDDYSAHEHRPDFYCFHFRRGFLDGGFGHPAVAEICFQYQRPGGANREIHSLPGTYRRAVSPPSWGQPFCSSAPTPA